MGRILCLDYGEARIGVAICDPTETIASPLQYINARNELFINDIISLVNKMEVERIVIGLPLDLKGRVSNKAKEVKEFSERLKQIVNIPIDLWDERYTTVIAERTLHSANIKAKKQREIIDSLSAQIILQNYLDSKKHK